MIHLPTFLCRRRMLTTYQWTSNSFQTLMALNSQQHMLTRIASMGFLNLTH